MSIRDSIVEVTQTIIQGYEIFEAPGHAMTLEESMIEACGGDPKAGLLLYMFACTFIDEIKINAEHSFGLHLVQGDKHDY